MKIILHIGTRKTGSSTLQQTLSKNTGTFARHGILYPRLNERDTHSQLISACLDEDELPDLFGGRTPEGHAKRRAVSEGLWQELAAVCTQSTCATLVLSSEYIFGMRQASLARLLGRLSQLSTDINAVGYFRAPAAFYLSALQQQLKFGADINPPDAVIGYRARYQRLRAQIPGRLIIRPFERVQLRGGDICHDFIGCFADDAVGLLREIEVNTVNESMSAAGIALLLSFNQVHFAHKRTPGNPLSTKLLACIAQAEAQAGFAKPRLRRQVRDHILNAHRAELDWLRENLGIIFSDTHTAPPSHLPDTGLALEEIIHVPTGEVDDLRKRVLDMLLQDLALLEPEPALIPPEILRAVSSGMAALGYGPEAPVNSPVALLAKHLAAVVQHDQNALDDPLKAYNLLLKRVIAATLQQQKSRRS